MESRRTYRVFLSSPGDVTPERDIAFRVVQSINADLGYDALDIFRWEEEFYTAARTFQDQIIPSAECDLVLCIFWKHLGSDLPEQYRRSDGFLPTGTEYEFETAIRQSLASPDGVPDVLAYRKTAKKGYDEDNLRLQEAQRARLDAFWSRWFQNERGHFVAAFHAFETPQDFARDLDGHLRLWLQRQDQVAPWQGGTPFRGLTSFDVGDEDIFFGRDREISRTRARFLANAAAGTRFLMVTGASGAGKSSVLRAGVLPRLLRTQGAPGLPAFGRYAVLRPADIAEDWATGLAEALMRDTALGPELKAGDYDNAAALAEILRAGSAPALQPITKALQRAPTETGSDMALVLLLDQFEEIFTWSETERGSFLDLLCRLTEGSTVFCLASMRSEFLGRAAEVPQLARLCQLNALAQGGGRLIALEPPRPADLREIILGPARLAGLTYEDSLADLIEAEADPKALPALQLLLTELYAARDGDTLRVSAHEALGGVAGVMGAQGERALAGQTKTIQAVFPGLVRKLISAPDLAATSVSRPVAREDLDLLETQLAGVLVDHGLLVGGHRHLRLAHESLIQGWTRLSDIAHEEQALLRIRYRLSLLAARHATDPQAGTAGLLQGHLLQEARELARVWSAEVIGSEEASLPAYIAASDRAARRQRGLRLASGLGLVLLVIGAGFQGLRLQHDVQQASLTAELAQSTAKAAEASLAQDNPALAISEIRRARDLDPGGETLSLAWRVLLAADDPGLNRLEHGPFVDLGFDTQGTLWTLTSDGVLRGDSSTRTFDGARLIAVRHLPNAGILAVTADGQVRLHRDDMIQDLGAATGPLTGDQVSIIADARSFTVAKAVTKPGAEATAPVEILRCAGDGSNCTWQSMGPPGFWINALSLSSDATHLAVAGQDPAAGQPTVLKGPIGSNMRSLADEVPDARQVRFIGQDLLLSAPGPTGAQLFKATTDGRIAPVARIAGQRFGVDAATGRVAYACGSFALCVATSSPAGLQPLVRLRSLRAAPSAVAFHPDGQSVAVLLADGRLQGWDLHSPDGPLAVLPVSDAPIIALDARPDGTLAALDTERRLFLQDNTGPVRLLVKIPGDSVRDPFLVFLNDGRIAVADGSESVALVDPATGELATHQSDWPIARLVALDKAAFATSGLHQIAYDGAAATFERFGSGNVRIGGITAGKEQLFISTTDGALHQVQRETGAIELALPHSVSEDSLAAMSLDLSPDGRFLVATRSDDRVQVHDLDETRVAATLQLPTRDSKVVAFSPDGANLAVLTSAGALGLWRFDRETGATTPLFFADPVPPALRPIRATAGMRPATWITWQDAHRLAVATAFGDIVSLDIRPDRLDATLAALDALYTRLSSE